VPTVSAFWGDRAISRDDAAILVCSALAKLAAIDPLLATWRTKGRTRQRALDHATIDTSSAAIAALLRVERRDFGDDEMPELGFSMAAWNGADHSADQAAFSVRVGLHAANSNLRNNFVLDVPRSWKDDDPRIDSLTIALVKEFAPDEVALFRNSDRRVLWPRP
jgi:hypothetical protein